MARKLTAASPATAAAKASAPIAHAIAIRSEAHWRQLRGRRIGGSEVAALFDVQPAYALSLFALWQVKAGRIPAPEHESERADWGRRLEQIIAEAAAARESWTLGRAGYVPHRRVRGMGCTPDFVILDHHEEMAGPGLLQVKNVDALEYKRRWSEDDPPEHIHLQLQHELACAGFGWGAIAALVGGNRLEIVKLLARPKVIAAIEARIKTFWRSVRAGREPPPDAADSTAAALRAMFPDAVTGLEYDATEDADFVDRFAKYKQARLDRAAADAALAAHGNWLTWKMARHEIARYHGTTIMTARPYQRRGYAVEPKTIRHIRVTEE